MARRATKKGPPRPARPNDKGMSDWPSLLLMLHPEKLQALRDRAKYETMHWRLEHGGHGRAFSPGDVARSIINEYFENVSPLPEDEIGAAVRAAGRTTAS